MHEPHHFIDMVVHDDVTKHQIVIRLPRVAVVEQFIIMLLMKIIN